MGDLGSIPGWGRSPGEGNGNPLQCSCLENPRDGGAWWAAVYRVAQSWTRLKRLSSSSSSVFICKSSSESEVRSKLEVKKKYRSSKVKEHLLHLPWTRASLVAWTVKNLPAMGEIWVRSLGGEDPLEEGMATHSSVLG